MHLQNSIRVYRGHRCIKAIIMFVKHHISINKINTLFCILKWRRTHSCPSPVEVWWPVANRFSSGNSTVNILNTRGLFRIQICLCMVAQCIRALKPKSMRSCFPAVDTLHKECLGWLTAAQPLANERSKLVLKRLNILSLGYQLRSAPWATEFFPRRQSHWVHLTSTIGAKYSVHPLHNCAVWWHHQP